MYFTKTFVISSCRIIISIYTLIFTSTNIVYNFNKVLLFTPQIETLFFYFELKLCKENSWHDDSINIVNHGEFMVGNGIWWKLSLKVKYLNNLHLSYSFPICPEKGLSPFVKSWIGVDINCPQSILSEPLFVKVNVESEFEEFLKENSADISLFTSCRVCYLHTRDTIHGKCLSLKRIYALLVDVNWRIRIQGILSHDFQYQKDILPG